MSKLSSAAKGAVSGLGVGGVAGSAALGALNGFAKLTPSTSSNISINGQTVANAKNKNGTVSANYNMNADESALLDYTRKNLLSGLENVNVFSPEVRRDIKNQLNAYTKQGIKTINENYKPMIRDLQADIAKRFGNFDNSVFMDNLKSLENSRADALETLTENILAKQADLFQQELDSRYKYINQLSSVNKDIYSNIYSMLNSALSGLN